PSGPRFFGALARHLHVAAERQRTDAVLGVAIAKAGDRRIEAKLKLEHADADALGRQKMPELVHEHEHAENEREGQQCGQTVNLKLGQPGITSDFSLANFRLRPSIQFYCASDLLRTLTRPPIDCANGLEAAHLFRPVRIHRALDDNRYGCESDLSLQKSFHRDFIGRIQHYRQAPLRLERAVRQAKTRKCTYIRNL